MSLGVIRSLDLGAERPAAKRRTSGSGLWLVYQPREAARPVAEGSRDDRRLPFAQQWLHTSPHGGDAA